MSLEFVGFLFSQDNRQGQSLLVGVGRGDRYNPIRSDTLQNRGLYSNIHSVEVDTTIEADGNIVLLQNDDFTGPFFQMSDAPSQGDVWWQTWGHVGSVLLVASSRKGSKETRLSFHDQFLAQWESFLDAKLQGSRASREGDPTLTWEMLPANVSYLDSRLAYLRIYQPLHIHMPWYWPDYAASLTYHIYLYVNSDHHVRAWGARWAYWVEGGLKSGQIAEQLEPQVKAGLSALQDQLNQEFAQLDALGTASDVYYLPGRQTEPLGTGTLTGNTNDDITIVIAH